MTTGTPTRCDACGAIREPSLRLEGWMLPKLVNRQLPRPTRFIRMVLCNECSIRVVRATVPPPPPNVVERRSLWRVLFGGAS